MSGAKRNRPCHYPSPIAHCHPALSWLCRRSQSRRPALIGGLGLSYRRSSALLGRLAVGYNWCFASGRPSLLGGRSTVGHVALDHVIGVRIPASQPASAHPSGELRLGRLLSPSRVRTNRHAEAVSTKPRSGEVGPPSATLAQSNGSERRIRRRLSREAREAVKADHSADSATDWRVHGRSIRVLIGADFRIPSRFRVARYMRQLIACMVSRNASSTSFAATRTHRDTTLGSPILGGQGKTGHCRHFKTGHFRLAAETM